MTRECLVLIAIAHVRFVELQTASHKAKLWYSIRRCIREIYRRVGTLIVATIYLQLIQNRYMFRSFTVLQCSHQHCLQPVSSDVEVIGYL